MLIHKVNQSLWTLGISKELLNIKRGIHYFDINSKKYGGLETSYQNKYRNVFFSTIDKFHYITYRPYILIVIFSSLVLICFYLKMESSIYYLAVGSIAIIYYLSFLPFTQAYEFRYFAPTFYILFFSSIGILATLFINFVKRRKIKV